MTKTLPLTSWRGDVRNKRKQVSIGRPLHILLAEDNRTNQRFACLVLTKAGHSIEVAANGREAVDAVRRSDFDAILMDIQMPELDGVQAAEQIRALPGPRNGIPIIAVTAHAMVGAHEEYFAAGMNGYISKPFQPALLLAALEEVCPSDTAPNNVEVPDKSAVKDGTSGIEDLPLLDHGQLSLFGSVFSVEKMRTLASLYMLDVEARLSLIVRCRAQKDFDGIARQAHMIENTAGNLGAKQTSASARALEASCANGEKASLDRLIGQLRAPCEASSGELKAWLSSEPQPDEFQSATAKARLDDPG